LVRRQDQRVEIVLVKSSENGALASEVQIIGESSFVRWGILGEVETDGVLPNGNVTVRIVFRGSAHREVDQIGDRVYVLGVLSEKARVALETD